MRITTRSGAGALLTYCANAHPGETLDDVFDAIRRFAGPIRSELEVEAMALGVWLSAAALRELGGRDGAPRLRDALAREQLFAFTFNGFPFGNFFADVVKHDVYRPDWSTESRRDYTHELAHVLAGVLPDDLFEGTISTVPLAHRKLAGSATEAEALRNLCRLAEDLARLRDRSGKSIRVCLEPEPGCLLETTGDALSVFAEKLPEIALRGGFSTEAVFHQIALCFDTCHQAVAFETAEESLAALSRAMVPVAKVQLSNAVSIPDPRDPDARAALERLDEPRFLHQVRARRSDGSIAGVDDIDAVAELPDDRPWRAHFHVPIHRDRLAELETTRGFLEDAARVLADRTEIPHLEVETYTWTALPHGDRPDGDAELIAGIADELRFARGLVS